MAISAQGMRVKRELMTVVALRREVEAIEREWRELLTVLEESESGEEFTVAEAVNRERMTLKRALTERQLRNWARIGKADLTPMQHRILGMRYVQGCPWGDIIGRLKKSKQYLLREHNKALERLCAPCEKKLKKF